MRKFHMISTLSVGQLFLQKSVPDAGFYVEQGRGREKEGGKEDVHSSSMRIHKVARHIAINVGGTSREFGI